MMWPVGLKLPRLVLPILTLSSPAASAGLIVMVSAAVVPPTTSAVLLGSVGSVCRATAVILIACVAAALVLPSLSLAVITVDNVAPTAGVSGPTGGVRGQARAAVPVGGGQGHHVGAVVVRGEREVGVASRGIAGPAAGNEQAADATAVVKAGDALGGGAVRDGQPGQINGDPCGNRQCGRNWPIVDR